MANYNSINCPICDKRFNEDDDIVVCPQCGAPHHRECWLKHGECQFEGMHGDGFVWKHPEVEFSDEGEEGTTDHPVACVRCGTINEAGRLFCKNCGVALSDNERPQGSFGGFFPQPVIIDLNDPLGGAKEDESFDGVKAKTLADFIGTRSNYFMRIFKTFKDRGKRVFFNLAAFLFTGCWFISKKMYKFGILLTALMLVLNCTQYYLEVKYVGSVNEAIQNMTVSEYSEYLLKSSPKLMLVMSLYSTLVISAFAIKILCGLFANNLYKKHCIKTIKSVNPDDTEEISDLCQKKGGANTRIAITVFLLQFLLNYIFMAFFI